jgi:hypothetical protein
MRNPVRIRVGRGSAVLEVTVALGTNLPGDTDRGTTSSDAPGELVDGTSLVPASETLFVLLAVDGDVIGVAGLELLDGGLDMRHTTLDTHLLGGEVRVETSAIPVALHGLGMYGYLGTEVFGDAVEDKPGNPELITHLDALAGSDLEFPLSGHHLGIGTGDVDTGIQAGLVVREDDVALDDIAIANTTVVLELRSGETTLGPAIGPVVLAEESVFLLKTEPWNPLLVRLHDLGAFVTVVELVGSAIMVPAFREDEDVGSAEERVGEDGYGLQVDIGVVTGSLAGGGAIEVPGGEIRRSVLLSRKSPRFGASVPGRVDPDVLSDDAALLVQTCVFPELLCGKKKFHVSGSVPFSSGYMRAVSRVRRGRRGIPCGCRTQLTVSVLDTSAIVMVMWWV